MEDKRPQWTNYISFIIATVGSAVGLGNIWRFPYVMGKYGGAMFLLIYLLIIALICVIPLSLELASGKIFKSDTISVYEKISPKCRWFGYLCIITVILISSFYFVVGGWILNYIRIFITNNIPSDFSVYFSSLNAGIFTPVILTLLFLFVTAVFPYKGLNGGIEKANNVMMPLFAVMLIMLAGYALTLDGAKEGLAFMFKPDFSSFNKEMILVALGQALFTLSVGMGAMITYGSYLKKEVNIKKSAYTLIFFDTLVAIIAGIMIFPIVFTNGIEPTAGATLVFISLPQIFKTLPYPVVLGTIFFLLLLFAAVTSGISILETSVASFVDYFKMTRKKAVIVLVSIVALLSIPAALSFGVLGDFKILNRTMFDLYDYLTSNVLLPFNTLIICIICGWFANYIAKEAFDIENTKFGKVLNFVLKFILPLILVCVLVSGL